MPRPRRALPTDTAFTGNNDRVVHPAQVILAEGLRAWFAAMGGNTAIADLLDIDPSNLAKILVCQSRLPKNVAIAWAKPLALSRTERRLLTTAAALCHTDVAALVWVNPSWKEKVKLLAEEFVEMAERRKLEQANAGKPKVRRRFK